MQTPKPSVCIDAPQSSGERAAAAMNLAVQLRQELLRSLPSRPLVSRPPVYRLVHHLGPQRRPGARPTPTLERSPSEEQQREQPGKYIAMGADEVKRLQRLAHMLASLSCELNLLLASVRNGADEEVEA